MKRLKRLGDVHLWTRLPMWDRHPCLFPPLRDGLPAREAPRPRLFRGQDARPVTGWKPVPLWLNRT